GVGRQLVPPSRSTRAAASRYSARCGSLRSTPGGSHEISPRIHESNHVRPPTISKKAGRLTTNRSGCRNRNYSLKLPALKPNLRRRLLQDTPERRGLSLRAEQSSPAYRGQKAVHRHADRDHEIEGRDTGIPGRKIVRERRRLN